MASCDNILKIGTANITDFVVKSEFRPYTGQIFFDISDSIFLIRANTTGVVFEVTDPNGDVYGDLIFGTPDINTTNPANTSFLLSGLKTNELFFGVYTIKVAYKDTLGTYNIVQEIDVCRPNVVNSKNFAEGNLTFYGDCATAIGLLEDKTQFKNNKYELLDVTYAISIKDTEGNVTSLTSANSNYNLENKFTGLYQVSSNAKAYYDLGCGITMMIEFRTNKQFDVQCGNDILDLVCCWQESVEASETNSTKGELLKNKMKELEPKVLLAFLLDRKGRSLEVKDIVSEIKTTLNCPCRCSDNQESNIITKRKISANLVASTITGTCGTTVTTDGVGNIGISSYTYSFEKFDNADTSFSITKTIVANCQVKYLLSINVASLVNNIVNELATNSTLLQSFQSVLDINAIVQSAIASNNQINIDWNCLPTPSYTYSNGLIESINTNQFVNIRINGIQYNTLSPILVTDTTAINAFLNGLGLGTFTYYANAVVGVPQNRFVGITSTNGNVLNSWGLMDALGSITQIPMVSNAGTIQSQIQHLVNQLCANINTSVTPCTLGIDESHKALVAVTNDIGLGTIAFRVDTTQLAPLQAGEYYNIRITSVSGVSEYNYINEIVTQDIHNWSYTYKSTESTPALNTLKYYISKNCTCCNGGVSTEIGISPSEISYVQFNTSIGGSGVVVCKPTLAVGNITANGGTFSISNVVNNGGGSTANYYLCDASGNILSGMGANGLSATFTSLSASTTYYIKAQMLTGSCVGVFTNLIAFTTTGATSFIRTVNASAINNTNYPTMGSVDNMCILGNGFTINVYKSTNTQIATGDILYTNVGLTTPLSGKYFVRDGGSNQMFSINPTTGVVGALAYSC